MILQMQNKSQILIVLTILLLVVFGVFFWPGKTQVQPSPTPVATQTQNKATVEIILSGDNVKKFDIEDFTSGTTALDMTKTVAQVKTQGEGEQAFVTSIEGREAQASKKEFWEFLVNDKQAEVGAGTYKPQSGDKISWRIQTF